MKFKTTFILLGILAVLFALVFFILPKKTAEDASGPKGPQLISLKAEEVHRIAISGGGEMIDLRKNDKGEWQVAEPLQARADDFEVNRLAEDLCALRAERVADESPSDPSSYGIPKKEIRMWLKGTAAAVHLLLGDENPVDNTLYARKEGEKRVVLLPVSIKTLLDKKLVDYRKKDIFSFEPSQVQRVGLKAKDTAWQAVKRDEDWFLEQPVSGLADRFKVESVFNTLSGLRAVEFVSEEKTPTDLARFGLDRPDSEVELSLPAAGQNVKFLLAKKDEKVYATTSLSSKIVAVDPYVFTDLDKKPEDLREKGVDVFNAWEAERLRIKSGSLDIALSKNEQGRWRFESGGKGEADASKVESFIRQVDSLQAVEFIDRPGSPASYGLDKPRAEIVIRVKDFEGKTREVNVLVGAEDEGKKQTVVKNPRLDYLLRVDSSFMADIPEKAEEWKAAEEDSAADKTEG